MGIDTTLSRRLAGQWLKAKSHKEMVAQLIEGYDGSYEMRRELVDELIPDIESHFDKYPESNGHSHNITMVFVGDINKASSSNAVFLDPTSDETLLKSLEMPGRFTSIADISY